MKSRVGGVGDWGADIESRVGLVWARSLSGRPGGRIYACHLPADLVTVEMPGIRRRKTRRIPLEGVGLAPEASQRTKGG